MLSGGGVSASGSPNAADISQTFSPAVSAAVKDGSVVQRYYTCCLCPRGRKGACGGRTDSYFANVHDHTEWAYGLDDIHCANRCRWHCEIRCFRVALWPGVFIGLLFALLWTVIGHGHHLIIACYLPLATNCIALVMRPGSPLVLQCFHTSKVLYVTLVDNEKVRNTSGQWESFLLVW